MEKILKELENLQEEAKLAIGKAKSDIELNDVKAQYLGKKSKYQEVMQLMRGLSVDDKKKLGMAGNEYKMKVEVEVEKKVLELEKQKIKEKLAKETIDITLPAPKLSKGSIHPLMQVKEEFEDICMEMGYEVEEGPDVEWDKYNFEMLNVPKDHPARDMQDTFYITSETLLRSHTSPVQVRTMLKKKGKPFKIICPGSAYRRDNDDATHSHQFSQIEGLVVGKDITMADLKGTLTTIFTKLFGKEMNIRFRPSFFPFTEPSVEVDVSCYKCGGKGCPLCKHTGWIELLGAGMVHPNVLEMAGYDSKKYTGFAFGVGLERLTMVKYQIDDIREFYTNNLKFMRQF
mgnify:FL=1